MECPHCYRQVKAGSANCPSCGGHIPPGQHLLQEAGLEEAPRFQTSGPSPAGRSGCHSPRLAKLGDRFNAFVLDIVVLFGVFGAADAWVLMHWSSFDKSELSLSTASLLAVIGMNALIFFVYSSVLEASCGATLGKIIVGIRVVRTGRRGALAAAAIRNLLRFVDELGLYVIGTIVAGCSPWRQRLGDLSAGTTVVEQEFGTVSKIIATAVMAAAMVGSAWVVPRICSHENTTLNSRYLNNVLVRVGRNGNVAYFRVARMQFDVQLEPKINKN